MGGTLYLNLGDLYHKNKMLFSNNLSMAYLFIINSKQAALVELKIVNRRVQNGNL